MEEIVNYSEDSESSDVSIQSCDDSMLSENKSKPVSFKSEEDDCSDDKETERDI